MDLATMAAWRWTCRAAYEHVRVGHKRALHALVARFTTRPSTFMDLVTEWSCVIGGEVALAFLLRDGQFEPGSLEVYATTRSYQAIVGELYCAAAFRSHLRYIGEEEAESAYANVRGYRREAHFHGRSGLSIFVYESTSMSPCTPISRSWTTALMNFVTNNAYGCAYKALLETRRGLIADLAVRESTERECKTLGRLVAARFSLATFPTDWAEFASTRSTAAVPRPYVFPCLRRDFLCPDQARFFGDGGSVVRLMDPLAANHAMLLDAFMPPSGHMPVWRLWSSVICEGGCAFTDDLLAGGIVSITMLPAYSPSAFTRQSISRGGDRPSASAAATRFLNSKPRSQTP